MRTSRPTLGEGAFGPEPSHDRALGRLLSDEVGMIPMDGVDWSALESRISARVARQVPAAWWSYATYWERRMLPLALAVGLAGAFSLWTSSASAAVTTQASASEVATAVASGASAEDAATLFLHAVTSTGDTVAGVPE